MMYEDLLKEKAKLMNTQDLIIRLKDVKQIMDNAEEEFVVLAQELHDRTCNFEKVKVKNRRWWEEEE